MFVIIIISILLLIIAYKKPIYAIVIILNINTLRALPKLNFNHLAFRNMNEGDLYFSVILPFLAYILIFIKLDFKRKRAFYFFDAMDVFFLISTVIIASYSFISPDLIKGIDFTLRYLVIGIPLFYMSKIVVVNSNNPQEELKNFLKGLVIASLITGTLGFLLAYSVNFYDPTLGTGTEYRIERITIPGVHPIPYCQAIGLGALICFSLSYTNGAVLKLKKKRLALISLILFLYLVFMVLITNTRGVLLALITSIFFFLVLYPRRISKKNARIFLFALILGVIFLVNYIDVEALFYRLLQSFNNDASFSERSMLLKESFNILTTNPIGVGTSGFPSGGYPHNIFLDYIVSFGVFGWALSFILITILIHYFVITYNSRKENPFLVLLFCIIIYFFMETLVSFTLWMHKGFYLSLGIYSAYVYFLKTKRQLQLQNEI